MQTFLSIVFVIGVLIFVHELGHLLVAKRAGILCREFAIGFGPKLFTFFRNETLYTIRLLPLGGYVRMAGEDPELVQIKTGHDVALIFNENNEVQKLILNRKKDYPDALVINVQRIDMEYKLIIEGYDEDEQHRSFSIHPQALLSYDGQDVQIAPKDRQFGSKTLGQRAATLFAGPLANILLALVLFIGVAMYTGIPVPEIGQVFPDTPAEEAGLQEGDRVILVDGNDIDNWTDMAQSIQNNPDREISFIVQRHGEQVALLITPSAEEDPMAEGGFRGLIGISPAYDFSFTGAFKHGFVQTAELSIVLFQAVGMLITGGLGVDALAGPVGIIDITGQAAEAGFVVLLQFMAFFSVNLAILNLLPIPALDGGRLLFLALEAVRGKPLDPQKEGIVHFLGFAFIILLVIVVTWNDIQRVFFSS